MAFFIALRAADCPHMYHRKKCEVEGQLIHGRLVLAEPRENSVRVYFRKFQKYGINASLLLNMGPSCRCVR